MIEDVSCPPDVRAGPAVALSAALDDAGRERLHMVSETCASPRLTPAAARTPYEYIQGIRSTNRVPDVHPPVA
jgi:hypothetical protein